MTDNCTTLMNRFNNLTSRINVYDVYGECYAPGAKSDKLSLYGSSDMGLSTTGSDDVKTYKTSWTAADYTPFLYKSKTTSDRKHLQDLPPCTFGNPIISYLNSAEVRAALHIPDYVQQWDLCSDGIGRNYTNSPKGSQWVYEELKG
jgi:hypothetical protein